MVPNVRPDGTCKHNPDDVCWQHGLCLEREWREDEAEREHRSKIVEACGQDDLTIVGVG
jgi:hypothetical protein